MNRPLVEKPDSTSPATATGVRADGGGLELRSAESELWTMASAQADAGPQGVAQDGVLVADCFNQELAMASLPREIEPEVMAELRRRDTVQARKNGHAAVVAGSTFETVDEDHYRLTLPAVGIVFELDRLRRERGELIGELSVSCSLPGAQTFDGRLSVGDLNLSSVRAREDRAKLLAARSRAPDIDWTGLVEELCQRVLQADRIGPASVDLRTVTPPSPDDVLHVQGLNLYRRHPAILFGDGGTCKSLFALQVLGELAQRGLRVGFFDWELAPEEHRERLERIFWAGMPWIEYVRCERPLVYEVDRLRRIVRDKKLDFAVYDSIVFACDGPPESAEIAGRYLRACRQIGCGSLHIAHTTKGENGDKKPFGSVFWHNGARCTWFVKLAEGSQGTDVLRLGFLNRKVNLGRLLPPFGLSVTFETERTTFRRTDFADDHALATKLGVRQRIQDYLRSGPKIVTEISEDLGIELNTVTQTIDRSLKKSHSFIVLDGNKTGRRIGLSGS